MTDFLLLLRAGLYESPELLDGFQPLSAGEWETIYEQSKRQTVSGIIYRALSFLPDECLPPYPLLLRWTARVHRIELSHAAMEKALAKLQHLFAAKGITPILQKGLDVARFYAQPQLRVCGDIDLYFPKEIRTKADEVILNSGIRLMNAPDGSSVYDFGGIEVEHHSSLIELHSPLAKRRLRHLLAAPADTITLSDGTSVAVPAPLTDLVMINVHIMKHCLGMGIGMRHFCDYALACRRLLPIIGEQTYLDTCRRLGISRWTNILHSFIATYLAFDGANGAAEVNGANEKSGEAPMLKQTPTQTLKQNQGSPAFSVASVDPVAPVAPEKSKKISAKVFDLVMEGDNFGLYRRDKQSAAAHALRRKGATLRAFITNANLAMRIAPAETISTMLSLAKGNL